MAERRMLHAKVSTSADVDELREKFGSDAALWWTWLSPHLDRWGCIHTDRVRRDVIPLWSDVDDKRVKTWVAWCVKRGMLERVVDRNGRPGVRVPSFHDHQRGAEFAKEAPSPFEPTDITDAWTRNGRSRRGVPKNTSDAGRSQTSRRPVADQSQSGLRERKGREGNVIPSPSVPSGEGGVGEGHDGPVGSAGRGQPPGPAFVIDEEAESAASVAALREQFASSELTRPFLKILGGEDG